MTMFHITTHALYLYPGWNIWKKQVRNFQQVSPDLLENISNKIRTEAGSGKIHAKPNVKNLKENEESSRGNRMCWRLRQENLSVDKAEINKTYGNCFYNLAKIRDYSSRWSLYWLLNNEDKHFRASQDREQLKYYLIGTFIFWLHPFYPSTGDILSFVSFIFILVSRLLGILLF